MVDDAETTAGERHDATAGAEGGGEETGVERSEAALVKDWCSKIKKAKTHFDDDYKRMRKCTQIAKDGAEKEWLEGDKFVVPVLNRHINQAVANIYAKNPKPAVKRRNKVYFKLWDEKPESLQAAMQSAGMGDPMGVAIVNEVVTAQTEIQKLDVMAKTVEVVDEYYCGEQAKDYKMLLKRLVRRTKVTGVGYMKLGWQRIMGEGPPMPERDAKIQDIRSKIERIEEISASGQMDLLDEDSPEIEELKTNLEDLERDKDIIVREGPVMSYPKSTAIIIDPMCDHLRTFNNAGWVAQEFDFSPSRIMQLYEVDVRKDYRKYQDESSGKPSEKAKVWEVWDSVNQQMFVICEGYPGFLKRPSTPEYLTERFYPFFALVFNETEESETEDNDGSIYPLSDVWLARHPQDEYNRSRQGLREHRIAARPYYVAAKGALADTDKNKLGNHAAHEVIELEVPVGPDVDINSIVQRGASEGIDPNLYEVETVFQDILRTIGTQEANLGGVSGGTATESSIAESSRMSSVADNTDDLDDFMSQVAHCRGQLYLQLLSVETVQKIAGPGAVWPEHDVTRQEAAEDLALDIKAGSSGRPNTAAELSNMERGMPFVLQLPGINPTPVAEKYLSLLDMDLGEAIAEGMPSIMQLNQAMAPQGGGLPTGDPSTDPNAQGLNGAANQQQPDGPVNETPQAGFPTVN